jgi:hypothetical protein
MVIELLSGNGRLLAPLLLLSGVGSAHRDSKAISYACFICFFFFFQNKKVGFKNVFERSRQNLGLCSLFWKC